MLFKDLIYSLPEKASGGMVFDADVDRKSKEHSGFMKVHYHNKGKMIGLPQILNSRYVRGAMPQF